MTVILAIATDGTSTESASAASKTKALDPRDQSIYDDGYRAGSLAFDSDQYLREEDRTDPTSRCNNLTQAVPQIGLPSAVKVELYDHDDFSLWITGCVEGYQASK
ncbi:hypothetical protein FOV72_20845 [Gordonia rubripertincta]|uniref:hypothetical protein n=1 Tax=Gordonia rubripertincta TaxID=36822 RepID=UPI00117C27B1|nr:hypothetical protein [Gordonia rubripertincta]TSD93100.1 hypothetical protein FOV72_20845 [Gordonia rubripertincta]